MPGTADSITLMYTRKRKAPAFGGGLLTYFIARASRAPPSPLTAPPA